MHARQFFVLLFFFFFFFFFFISDVHQPLSQIRISLAASLGAGQIIFVAGIGATGNTVRSPFNVERGGG